MAQSEAGSTDRVHGVDTDGHLKHSRFVGLKEDKEAGGVVREPGS
jgi:hypothetical protein